MVLEKLSIIDYKNLEQVEIEFSPKINCFIGKNGMGKTNLLDAIYFLSFCKSHNNSIDTQNINNNADLALIQGWYQLEKREEFFCSIRRKRKKQFKRNKKEYDKLSEHIGLLPLVMISPNDSDIINGNSEERRKFLDITISQFDKEYLQTIIKYNKALQQRNALLKSTINIDESLLELWEEELNITGKIIYQKRKNFITDFAKTFEQFYNFICNSNEKVEIKYTSHFEDQNFESLIKQRRSKDSILGYTSVGIHRDDLDMLMNGYPIKKNGSQGQNKTYIISLKFAQFDYLKRQSHRTPILLLDDIFDKLDTFRVEKIVDLVSNDNFGQIFITDTNRKHLDHILSQSGKTYQLFEVNDGQIVIKN